MVRWIPSPSNLGAVNWKLLGAVVLIALVAGCGGIDDAPGTETPTATPAEELAETTETPETLETDDDGAATATATVSPTPDSADEESDAGATGGGSTSAPGAASSPTDDQDDADAGDSPDEDGDDAETDDAAASDDDADGDAVGASSEDDESADDDRITRLHPSEETRVNSGDEVLFEAAVDEDALDVEGPSDIDWQIYRYDDDAGTWDHRATESASTAWVESYYAHTGDFAKRSWFDERGTYRVEATVETDDGRASSGNWTVTVDDDVDEPFSLEIVSPQNTTVYHDETEDYTVRPTGGDGGPYRVLWQSSQDDEFVEISDVEESGDTTAIEWENSRVADGIAPHPYAVDASGRLITADRGWNLEVETPVTVEITETNSPVERGEDLEVTADLENVGTETHDVEVELWVENVATAVETTTVTVDPDDTATVTFTYDTSDEDRDEFDVYVEAITGEGQDIDSETVEVTES